MTPTEHDSVVAQVATWATGELDAEIRDLDETLIHLEGDLHRQRAELAAQEVATKRIYGTDETRWPGSSLHTVQTMRGFVRARRTQIDGVAELLAVYRTARLRRGS